MKVVWTDWLFTQYGRHVNWRKGAKQIHVECQDKKIKFWSGSGVFAAVEIKIFGSGLRIWDPSPRQSSGPGPVKYCFVLIDIISVHRIGPAAWTFLHLHILADGNCIMDKNSAGHKKKDRWIQFLGQKLNPSGHQYCLNTLNQDSRISVWKIYRLLLLSALKQHDPDWILFPTFGGTISTMASGDRDTPDPPIPNTNRTRTLNNAIPDWRSCTNSDWQAERIWWEMKIERSSQQHPVTRADANWTTD